jgi:hypothetical protein
MEDKIKCPHCGKECSKFGLNNHIRRTHTEAGNKQKGGIPWNKGLSKQNDKRLEKASNTLTNTMKLKKEQGLLSGCFSNEYYNSPKHKINASKGGGYRKGSGRGKHGWYKGYWCDSSWELAFVIYNLEHNIDFVRNTEKFRYIFEGQIHYYIPDFIIDGIYIEIKNFDTEKTIAKHTQFKLPLKVLKRKDLKHILQYVEDKYGKDFIKLYE